MARSLRSSPALWRLLGVAVVVVAVALIAGDSDDDGDGETAAPGAELTVRVVRVVDGDTVVVDLDGAEERVRYIGIDTPESAIPGQPVECFGADASDANASLVEGRTVRLRFDDELRDRYGRLLAYVYVDELLVNARLVARGFARTLEIEPNTDMAALLRRLELEASRRGAGFWGACRG